MSSLASRILGVVRDHMLTAKFGATRAAIDSVSELDIYYAAFRLPDFIYNLLILGTISSVFIPIFSGMLREDKDEAWKIANTVVNLVLLVTIGISFALAVFAPYIVPFFVYGFTDAATDQTIFLTRIMLFTPVIFGLSAVASSVLNSFKRFTAMSFSPVFYNVGIIVGIIYLEPRFGILGVTYGVVAGACLHLLAQIPSVFSCGYRPTFKMDLKHPSINRL